MNSWRSEFIVVYGLFVIGSHVASNLLYLNDQSYLGTTMVATADSDPFIP